MNQAKEVLVAALRANNPTLLPANLNGSCDRVTAAKNMRIQLKAAFPGVKFSVTSESYSGGSSINVSWTDGPLRADVEAIVDQYAYGSFNGMEDLYEYAGDLWPEAFGGAKYVFANRDYSDEVIQEAIDALELVDFTVAQYNNGSGWRYQLPCGRDYAQVIRNYVGEREYGTDKRANAGA